MKLSYVDFPGTFQAVAQTFRVARSTVQKIWTLYCDSFREDLLPKGGGNPSNLSQADLELMEVLKREKGSITLKEIYQELEVIGECGKELLAFVKEQQDEEKQRVDEEREERQRELESKKLEAEERERIWLQELDEKEKEGQMGEREKEAQRRHELAVKELELQSANVDVNSASIKSTAKLPKLPTFVDGKDDLDSYLQRFEQFAKNNNWDQSTWSTSLSALLTGRALDVYSRLSETAAVYYKQLKEALLKRYELTESGFKMRFREGKPEQFVTRLNRYLTRRSSLSEETVKLAQDELKKSQWKGPFVVESIVRVNDYRIKVGDKVKTFHANMLKEYVERQTTQAKEREEVSPKSDREIEGTAVTEQSESGPEGAVNDKSLLELGTMQPKETVRDVTFGQQLNNEQKVQLQEVVRQYEHVFTDVPGNANIIEHEVNLTSDESIRSKPYRFLITLEGH
ncbi:vicilin-like seed storage At2g18540 [Paramuricea clavata]|uniref:Vicilin-like seed storage At2g18540, partial n=1 Tax=Paramuricea clavata TaxID=317549 RepID=A0A6S7KW05_PARCT|nr:vicilin-like seed storage At2g18540 [Paramuricea clavata]